MHKTFCSMTSNFASSWVCYMQTKI